jgi:hypothetical protein
MLSLLIALFIIAAITVFPVMIAARMVGAKNTSFGYALLALILQGVMSALLNTFIHRPLLSAVLSLLLGPAIYAGVLKTTYLRGFVISILFVLIALLFLLLLAPMMGFHYMDNMQMMRGDVV